ncbi:MAG: response regulator [Acidobacteria bacterium]|nr:MAG: response regulator [Acidobacteriota bacterium]
MEPGAKVLVVDDYEPNARGMRDLLVAAGHTVRVAHNGADALRFASDEPPDLVVLDVVMPGMSGVEVCRELKTRSLTRLTPVVLVTGNHDHAYRLAGLDAGADDFIKKPLDVPEFRTRVKSLLRLKRLTDELESTEAIMTMLGQIVEARDPYTEGHCERLADYATALGAALGLPDFDLDTLNRGAALHDVGKIAVPDGVLLKPGRLDPDEMALMRQHPVIGDNLCRTVRSLERVRPIVRSHHEREDGRGYPDGLSGREIPLLAQIVGVVDVFDALTTNRPYRTAMTTQAAYDIMLADAASGWCPVKLVRMFIDLHRSTHFRSYSGRTQSDVSQPSQARA